MRCALFIAIALTLCATSAPLSPDESMATMQWAPELRVELVAAEPDVVDPVSLAYDETGQPFVVENTGYPEDATGAGRIATTMAMAATRERQHSRTASSFRMESCLGEAVYS